MGHLLLQILPVAVAIAINPVPIIAAIVMTATEKPVANGIAYLTALTAVSFGFGAAVLTLFHGTALGSGTRTGHLILVLWLVFGLAFLAACIVLLVRRPKPGEKEREPGWMRWIGRLGPLGAAVVGVIVNLAVFFAYHVLWRDGFAGPFDWLSAAIGLAAAIALFRYKIAVIPLIAACGGVGMLAKALL